MAQNILPELGVVNRLRLIAFDTYLPDHASWHKIRNHNYSQWVGREELFEHERGLDPDFQVWNGCALACLGEP